MQALCKLTNWAGLISGQCKSEDAPICCDSDSFQGILVFGPGTKVCVYHMDIGTWYVHACSGKMPLVVMKFISLAD